MKHTKAWFINRVGKWMMKGNGFDHPIQIASKMHASAMFISQQDKGHVYTEMLTNDPKNEIEWYKIFDYSPSQMESAKGDPTCDWALSIMEYLIENYNPPIKKINP